MHANRVNMVDVLETGLCADDRNNYILKIRTARTTLFWWQSTAWRKIEGAFSPLQSKEWACKLNNWAFCVDDLLTGSRATSMKRLADSQGIARNYGVSELLNPGCRRWRLSYRAGTQHESQRFSCLRIRYDAGQICTNSLSTVRWGDELQSSRDWHQTEHSRQNAGCYACLSDCESSWVWLYGP